MWFGLPSWARPNVDCVRMSRCCDMSEQGTTLFSLPKIALITQHPKKTQLQNCLSVYLFCVTPEAFGKCVSEIGVRVWSWTCLCFKKKCGLEILCHHAPLKSATLFLFLSVIVRMDRCILATYIFRGLVLLVTVSFVKY